MLLPQELNSSLSAKPKTFFFARNLSLYPVLPRKEIKHDWGNISSSRESSSGSFRVVVAALAAEAEVADEEEGAVGVLDGSTPPSKPKTGKAALPLKRDRVNMLDCICFNSLIK